MYWGAIFHCISLICTEFDMTSKAAKLLCFSGFLLKYIISVHVLAVKVQSLSGCKSKAYNIRGIIVKRNLKGMANTAIFLMVNNTVLIEPSVRCTRVNIPE